MNRFTVPFRGIALAVAFLVLGLPVAHAQLPEWKQHYLKGLEQERRGSYREAAKQFAMAERLHPDAAAGVDFGEAGAIDYDPYYHGALCLVRSGGPLGVARRLAQRSLRSGVTPRSKLEALRTEVFTGAGDAPRGTGGAEPTPFWNEKRRRPLRPREGPGARPPEGPGWRPPGTGGTGPRQPAAIPVAPAATPASAARTGRPAMATVDLSALPPDILVTADGKAYPPKTRFLLLPAGRHTLVVTSGGRVVLETNVELRADEVLRPILPTAQPAPASPGPTPSPAQPAVASPAPPAARPGGGSPPLWRRLGTLIPLGAAVLVLVALALLLRRRKERTPSALETTPTRRMATPGRGSAHGVSTPSPSPSGTGRGTGSAKTAMAGRRFGPYVVEGRLGTGGMATTYLARRSSDGKEVAVKVPHEHCLDDDSFRRRFVREGQLGSQLHHPNIVRILEASEEGETPYIAMELVRGTTLRDLLRTAGELPLETVLDLARQVAEALDYAHSKGVVHRDLKPENLMILPDGRLVVMDFGIARVEGGAGLTATSVFVGTPAYAAPEAIQGKPVDHRVDLYALGVVMVEMLEGGLPYAGSNPLEQLRAHVEGRLLNREELERSIPDDVWELIEGLIARDPGQRFPNAEMFLVALREVIRRRELGTAT
ncbi:MAG TPA: serine/threonine protein kinase [Acidobacteria bacterium]|nr:serine/threonine protein kinase [Acidobacteriota bacterium]